MQTMNKFLNIFEKTIIAVLIVIMVLIIIVATIVLGSSLVRHIISSPGYLPADI